MRFRLVLLSLAFCVWGASSALCGTDNARIAEQHRVELIRTFNSDLVYIRTRFPMGKVGLTIKDGNISPSGQKLDDLLAIWGPSVKPGDRAIITKLEMKGNRLHFEINGGPVKKEKWYQHIQVGA